MSTTYIQQINGTKLYAERALQTATGVNIDSKFAEIEQEITAVGAFEVVPLTSGANPVPDVAEPSTKVIYLTKESGSSKTDPYTEWIYIAGDPTGTWEVIGETSIDLSGYKTKQTAVTDPTASGTGLSFIATASQDANGVITVTKTTVQDGTTSQKGVVQLEDSHASTSTTTAATPKAVKEAYDLADGKQDPITFQGTYNASTNKAATESTVSDAIDALDAEETSTDGTNVQVKVTQVNGVITAVNVTTDNTASTTAVSAKADKVTGATSGNFAGLDSAGNLTDSGSKAADFKTKQNAVADPSVPDSGTRTAIQFIDTISQNANGEITATKKEVQAATTSAAGITSLSSAVDSSAENVAATPKAVKTAYDLADGKYSLPSGGVPKTDLASGVQSSLDAADSALQPVSGAVSGNFVAFGSNGSIADSGAKAADFATATQGGKADSAIQGVKVNGTALTPDANKVVDIESASLSTTGGTYGVVSLTTIVLD